MCAELFGYIDERPGLVRWRQGRCLPYGEGIAFWALGEIVKAEAGILESDSPEQAAAKLERALPEDDPDCPGCGRGWRRWSARRRSRRRRRSRSRPGGASWRGWRRTGRRCWCSRICTGPTRRCSSFLEHLADWSEGVPLLVLCTARPELHEQHPTWAAGLRNATTINLPR